MNSRQGETACVEGRKLQEAKYSLLKFHGLLNDLNSLESVFIYCQFSAWSISISTMSIE